MREGYFVIIFLFLFVAFELNDGATVSPENLFDQDFQYLDAITPQDLNLTEFSIAMKKRHPLAKLNVIQIIKYYNYVAESHEIVTSDGYILEVHRIIGNKNNFNQTNRPVVFLMHGLLCSSVDWVIAGPSRGLGFILSDAGYDVWMGNARGNFYSRKHKTLTIKDPKFWDFSWHEIGKSDLPAMIDYALVKSGQKKLYYVGHSQGSTTFFVTLSEIPHYNEKIHAMFSIAPVAYCSNMYSPVFQFLARNTNSLSTVMKIFGQHEFKPTTKFFDRFKSLLCTNLNIAKELCMNVIFMITGFNKEQFDLDLFPAVLAHLPAGSSTQQFIHYGQIIKSGIFRQFDHGLMKNWKEYRSMKPPQYNLDNIRVPVALHYSVNDWLSHPKDVEKLYSQLPNVIGKFRVPNDKFNHLDYLWAKDVKDLLYVKILSLMERYGK